MHPPYGSTICSSEINSYAKSPFSWHEAHIQHRGMSAHTYGWGLADVVPLAFPLSFVLACLQPSNTRAHQKDMQLAKAANPTMSTAIAGTHSCCCYYHGDYRYCTPSSRSSTTNVDLRPQQIRKPDSSLASRLLGMPPIQEPI